MDDDMYTPSHHPAAFWANVSICVALVLIAGLMAGLTMGLLSLDKLNILILKMEGTREEKTYAEKVAPVLNRHHYLLVTLLLVNAGANEALPIFLNRLVPEVVSIILSVTCVLLFGEIVPSAVFTGPNQLRIAAYFAPIVKVLMFVTSPISYPISRVLDFCFGNDHEVQKYKRNELKALIALQKESHQAKLKCVGARYTQNVFAPNISSSLFESPLTKVARPSYGSELTPRGELHSAHGTRLHVDEVTIIHGALDLSSKTVAEVMIPIEKVYMLEYNTKLSQNVMADILASGHSRIPVYKEHICNIVGILLVKRLIVVDPDDQRAVQDLCLRKPIVTTPDEACYSILNEFQKGRSHIALVTSDARLVKQCWDERRDIPANVKFVGIVTIEDVIEELIQEEIQDESDVYVQGLVNYWRSTTQKHNILKETSFVKSRLRLLAQRARARVKNRKMLMSDTSAPAFTILDDLNENHDASASDSTPWTEV